jgi:hypothetical protein
MNSLIDMWFPSRLDPDNCPLDFFIAKYVAGLDRDRISPASSKMRAGGEAHNAFELWLGGKPIKEAIETCKHELSKFNAPNAKDHEQHKLCMKHFDAVVNNFVLAAEECRMEAVDIEQLVKTNAEEIELNVGGYVDVIEQNVIVECKTKWPSPFLKADGSYSERTQSLPKKPTAGNIRQTAVYSKAANKPGRIIYANHKGYQVFDHNNCVYLQPQALNAAFETMRISARTRQDLLKINTNPEIIARYIVPNFGHYVWNNADDEIIARVKQIWGYRNG